MFGTSARTGISAAHGAHPGGVVDPRVEAVHHAFRAWEQQRMHDVYAIQAATRGEVPSETERKARRRLLGKIRVVEHEALEALTQATEAGGDPARVDLSGWTWARAALIDTWERGSERMPYGLVGK